MTSALIPSLLPIPAEFRELCQWAPRAPVDHTRAPYTAQDCFEISKQWPIEIRNSHLNNSTPSRLGRLFFVGIPLLLAIILVAIFAGPKIIAPIIASPTLTIVSTEVPLSVSPSTPILIEMQSPTVQPSETQPIPTETPASMPTLIPSPGTYFPILVFDNKVTFPSSPNCWRKDISPFNLMEREGFFRKYDYDWWAFAIVGEHTIETPIWTSLEECLDVQLIRAMALNAWVTHL